MADHKNLAAALVAALGGLSNVTKAHRADSAPGKHTYANISDVIAETRPVLAAHGLVALTPVYGSEDGLAVRVILLHESGERLDFDPLPFPVGKDAQATGSWITYMRRYALLSALGMGAEDDDGQSAGAGQKAPAKPAKKQPAQQPLADAEKHKVIRDTIAALAPHQRTQFAAWFKAQRLPSIKDGDALTEAQAEAVLDQLNTFPAEDEDPERPFEGGEAA